jgi:hypothetical protein
MRRLTSVRDFMTLICYIKIFWEVRRLRVRSIALSAMLGAAFFHATPALSHHSNVAFEVTKIITVTGVVKEFRWVNPHTWLVLTVADGKGGKVEWACEGRASSVLARAGWAKNSLLPGDTITVDMSPAKDGSNTSLVARVTKADGTILPNAPPPTD